MIPKTIHYCWFGGNPLPEDAHKCIASWKKYCPDYEIMQWDESNYDVTKSRYMKEAYAEKKWACVSDYARLDIIYEHGGIYLDTDVEIIKPFDGFLSQKMFCGWEKTSNLNSHFVNLGIGFGSEAENPIIKEMIDLYDTLSFYTSSGELNLTPCPRYQTSVLNNHGLMQKYNDIQHLDQAVVYPEEYFCPLNYSSGELELTENSHSIHHYTASWHTIKEQKWWKLCQRIYVVFGEKKGEKIRRNMLVRIISHIYVDGLAKTLRKAIKKLRSEK